jgi:hypothetical protein
MSIREHVDVTPQPTVVRLEHLQAEDARWISESYYVTDEIETHLSALRALLNRDEGCGIFLIGHYGSGKSHFLAYLAQQLHGRTFATRNPAAVPVSLLNYPADLPLESILQRELQLPGGEQDRRETWKRVARRYPAGLLLVVDELSEFLRAKPSPQSFNEDLRFLQFLGEWAQGRRLWILAAMQEQIEHTGEIEYDLFRKIKDRYPVRLLLTPSHVRDLIARRLLRKKPSYPDAVEKLAQELTGVYPAMKAAMADLTAIYPLHPATLDLLEEVRDRFSQARGIIDFTLTRLLGDEARHVEPFLDRPWGELLTPDSIVDHFSDLFEVQPEFLPIAQKVLPYFRTRVPELFESAAHRELAWRVLKLLILVYLSPRQDSLDAEQAAQWLLLKVSSIDPRKNRDIVQKVLDTIARQGAYVKQQEGGSFRLDLEDDSKEHLEQLLARAMEELRGRGDPALESLVPLLHHAEFNPFAQPRDRWHTRKVRWHFHEWDLNVYFGGGMPPERKGLCLQIGLPWGPAPEGACHRVLPTAIEPGPELLELAALQQLRERPLPPRVLTRIQQRIGSRTPSLVAMIRSSYVEARVLDPQGNRAAPPLQPLHGGLGPWVNTFGEWLLRQTYPMFERFAPGFGPLPREAYRQFMKHATENELGSPEAPEFVKLIREAYLVPMGLMRRNGQEYMLTPRMEANELVRMLAGILEHLPSPARVYQHFAAPVYGLVTDQVHLLLLVLLVQGEIDIVKGEQSYRDLFETLPNPLQYDKILPGKALGLNEVRDLQALCEGFRVPVPKQWSVLAQKRAIEQLRRYGARQRDQLSEFVTRLQASGEAGDVVSRVEGVIAKWGALEKGDHEIQAFQHFQAAAGQPQAFVFEANEIASLPQRFERLMRELQRFRHLFSDPVLVACTDPVLATRIEALPPAPPLSEPEDAERWLDQARLLYQRYQEWYRARHEQWRSSVEQHPGWSYRIPSAARSRHVMAGALVNEIESLVAESRSRRCQGMSSLEFQPTCRCGFDGVDSPLSETLRRFEEAARKLDAETALFFQQDKVKSRVREWVGQGVETNTGTLSYLEGKSAFPEVESVSLFDQHLAGLELVKPVNAQEVLEVLGDRVWEKDALLKALARFFERVGPRISFRRQEPAPRRDLVEWCYGQALAHAQPLPPGFSRAEQALAAEAIDPRTVSDQALARIEELGLGEDALLKVLGMVLEGAVQPTIRPARGPVAAALYLLEPARPRTAGQLAALSEALFDQHTRMMKLKPQHWLARMEELANSEMAEPPVPLETALREHIGAQWVVVDCLGLPLLRVTAELLPECFPRWKNGGPAFAQVSERTTTGDFYNQVIEQKFGKTFEKIDAVDRLVHERRASMEELARLAKAELGIAFRRLNLRLDPSLPILIFSDHGFRLSQDGTAFTHGAASTLERLIPLLFLNQI